MMSCLSSDILQHTDCPVLPSHSDCCQLQTIISTPNYKLNTNLNYTDISQIFKQIYFINDRSNNNIIPYSIYCVLENIQIKELVGGSD